MVRNTYLSSKNCCFLIISIAEFWFALSSTAQGDQSSSLLSATNNSNNQPQPYITDITHTVPRSKKIQSHETSKRMPLGGWWGYVASWNMRQKNIGWENFEKLTKSF